MSTNPAAEHVPSPLVHEVTERDEGDLVQRDAHQVVDVRLQIVAGLVYQTQLVQVVQCSH